MSSWTAKHGLCKIRLRYVKVTSQLSAAAQPAKIWDPQGLSFYPRDVLDDILNLIESVSEGFPTCSFN